MQYMFQTWAMPGTSKFREMLLTTAAEEIGHIEMLATAVAQNLAGAPLQVQEAASQDPVAGQVLNGVKEMLAYLIARDTMHQQQWLAVLEETGGLAVQLPIPDSSPQEQEKQDFNYVCPASRRTAPDRRAVAGRKARRSTAGASSASGRWSP